MAKQIEIARGIVAHASGALWMEAAGALLVADAHLGYGWAQRRKGELGPVGDGGAAERLRTLVEEFTPRELVFLGDTVHAPKPLPEERRGVEEVISHLAERTRVKVVEGNHDRAFRRDFGHLPVEVEKQWRWEDCLALHGDKLHLELPEAGYYIVGHFHPAVGLRDDAGARRRVPVFLTGTRGCVLPAFSPFASGFDILRDRLPRELKEVLGEYRVLPATGRQVVELPAAALREMRETLT
ncbi:MAG: hypothetical protein NW208_05800 [Bryobacter sp.]|nr:hypothetical protein [Bryobacter sp.]